MVGRISGITQTVIARAYAVNNPQNVQKAGEQPVRVGEPNEASEISKLECQTCKSRRYVDSSGDSGVSFKAPGYISPESSAAVVAAHEGEHVAIAQAKGAEKGNRLISASVTLHTDICPECGKAYVSGGQTRTQIEYSDPSSGGGGGTSSVAEDLKGSGFDKSL